VEELSNFNGQKDLVNNCPKSVRDLMSSKNAFDLYDKFVETVYQEKSTRGMLGVWKDDQFVSVLDAFRDDFAAKDLKVVLCKRTGAKGTYRWIEYIDVGMTGGVYVPQYDVSNFSGQVIKTAYRTLEFPNGVAVEKLSEWNGRKKLQENIPIQVEKMLESHGLMDEYHRLVGDIVDGGRNTFGWDLEKLKLVVHKYRPLFAMKGIVIHVAHKEEQVDKHRRYFRWIEFIDSTMQPNYVSQRSADTKAQDCCVM